MSTIAIAGGHGQIALHLTRILSERGDRVLSLVRKTEHRADVESAGGELVVVDLEQTDRAVMAGKIAGADAVVFAAGAGPGSGAERKESVDYEGAVKLRDAALAADVSRYIMISSMGTDDPPQGDDVFEIYLRAKAKADQAVMESDLRWTIVRPGGLTDDEPTGEVTAARHVERGEIPRADVAAVIADLLARDDAAGMIVEVVGGDTPIPAAIDEVVSKT